ncbi:MAG: hypothetical protein D6803_05665 [Anaerolineae bacterium]|nr:MAG: hypothetical protein D6803_05665 [Anaerolineae bacterium]
MGTGAELKQSGEARIPSPRLTIDVPLLVCVVVLLVFGMLMMTSASWSASIWISEAETGVSSPWYLFFRQTRYLLLGLVLMGVAARVDYHRWRTPAVYLWLLTLVSLVLVLVIGDQTGTTRRSFLNGSIQPSELAKFVIVLYLAVWLDAKREVLNTWAFGLLPAMIIVGMYAGFIAAQPDLSATLMVMILGLMMYFLAGTSMLLNAVLTGGAALVGYVVLRYNFTGISRVDEFRAGMEDILSSSPHVRHALVAFVRGGWFGVGIGNSSTKLTTLPFPHTDSVFAVVGEELGVFGAVLVVGLFALLAWRGLVIASRAPDGLGALLASGLTLWIVLEAYMNMASLLGVMPFAGNSLPFFSVGGSNLVVSLLALGIVLNVSRQAERRQIEETRRMFVDAIVSLRRRDGWRRVSRARRDRARQRPAP